MIIAIFGLLAGLIAGGILIERAYLNGYARGWADRDGVGR